MARTFFPFENLTPSPSSFSLLPFRFARLNGKKDTVVNEAGESCLPRTGPSRSWRTSDSILDLNFTET